MGNQRKPGVSPERFELFGGCTFGYAALYGVWMYKNYSSVCSILMAVMTVLFMSTCMVRHERALPNAGNLTAGAALARQKKLLPGYIGILLFGAATCRTDDTFLIVMSHLWILFLTGACILSYFGGGARMGLVRYGASLLEKVTEPVSYIDQYFSDFKAYSRIRGGAGKRAKVIYVLIGIAAAIPLLFLMISLLASADEIFGDAVETILGHIFLSWDVVWFLVFLFVVLLYVYGLITAAPFCRREARKNREGTQEPIIAITAMGLLTVVYLLFSVVQILYLFLHNMSLPDGMTYAEYARQGFFQLLFVSALNIIMVLVCQAVFKRHAVLHAVLTVMSMCTYIMLASSALRMGMYIEEYGLTYLRILTYAALLALAFFLTFVIFRIYIKRFPLTPCFVCTAACVCILVAYIRPAHLAASYNVSHQSPSEIDFSYLTGLGADAADEVYAFIADNIDSNGNEKETDSNLMDLRYDSGTANMDYVVSYENGRNASYEEQSGISGFTDRRMQSYFQEIQEDWEEKGQIRGFNFSRYKASRYAERFFDTW